MKLRLASILLLLLAVPAFAGQVYSNGPINGTISAYSFTGLYGWEVADSFTVGSAATITDFSIGAWVFPGDTPLSVTWEVLTGGPDWDGGTVVATGSANFSNVYWGQGFGYYDIYTSSVTGLNVNLAAGNYWLELLNGATTGDSAIYWDENNGPSSAEQGSYGSFYSTIDSEAFTINGTTSSTPEPGTMILFGTGIVGLAGVIRRRIGL